MQVLLGALVLLPTGPPALGKALTTSPPLYRVLGRLLEKQVSGRPLGAVEGPGMGEITDSPVCLRSGKNNSPIYCVFTMC